MRTGLVAGLLLVLAALSGCVSVPTSGPVERVEGQPPACQNCVNVEVAPPTDGDAPLQIVQGYLSAMNNQGAYAVARQYLTKAAAEKWTPEGGVLIYRGKPEVSQDTKDTVTLTGRRVGTLNKISRTYAADDSKLSQNFTMVKDENGQWRISDPPGGLLVSQNAFTNFYRAVNLYFISNGAVGSLVPEPIYLPNLGNPANLASSLMKALLRGPSDWLAPAVVTAVPSNTTLKVDSVTINDGIAEVPLSDTVLALSDPLRAQLAAQIVYTMKQVPGVNGVLITVDGTRFRVPQSDPTTMVTVPAGISEVLDPVPPVAGSQLYVAHGTVLDTLGPNFDTKAGMGGALNPADSPVDSMAVSVTNTDVAAVIAKRTKLVSAETTPTDTTKTVTNVRGGVQGLLRPEFSRYGELWAIGTENGRQRLWMSAGDKAPNLDVEPAVFGGGRVTAFKISPDGTRMALIRETDHGSELGLARIGRAARVTVDGWHVLKTRQTTQQQVTQMVDVAWLDATDLLVLGAESKKAAVIPYTITDDALTITPLTGAPDWGAQELSVELHTQAKVVRGTGGQLYRFDGSQWIGFGEAKATAIAYPG